MKKSKVILTFIAFIAFIAISCSKEDNDGETLTPIEGKWFFSKTGVVIQGKEELEDSGANEGCDRSYMDLRANNVIVFGEFDLDGDVCIESTHEGVYSRTSTSFTTTFGGVTITRDILILTENELKLKDDLGFITVFKR